MLRLLSAAMDDGRPRREARAPERDGMIDITAPGLSFASPKGGLSKAQATPVSKKRPPTAAGAKALGRGSMTTYSVWKCFNDNI